MFRKVNEEKNLGIKKGGLFFSNSIEVLFEHLKVNLFPEDLDVFSKRILVVPSQGMQQWIHLNLASSLSISSGFMTTFLKQAIETLSENIFYEQKEFFLPTRLELFLKIYDALEHIPQEEMWQTVSGYIQEKATRRIELAKILSELFDSYGIYANEACLEWEKKPTHWQEALFAKIFQEWDYPLRVLPKLKIKEQLSSDLAIHLFAFSHLSPLHFSFFCKISRYFPVYFYQLVPCQEFWSDMDVDTHPSLLTKFGRVGREMMKLFEESEHVIEEAYIFFGGNTQLKKLQKELLSCDRNEDILEDDSIQIHVSSNIYSEVENLYQILFALFSEGKIEPKEVIVMTPQISAYAPYIQAIFGNKIPYRIADLPTYKNHSLIEGLFLLLDLEKKRWSAPAVLELFNHPLFFKKQDFSEEKMELLRTWIQKLGIRWAMDAEHRRTLLKKGGCQTSIDEATSSWMQGLNQLIEELCVSHTLKRISLTHAEYLGEVIELLNALYTDIKELESAKKAAHWILFLKKLIEKYFVPSEEEKILLDFFEKLSHAERHFPDKEYHFALIYTLLQDHLDKESVTLNRNQLQAVLFCTLLPMRAIPAKVICLLGMNQDAFPRKEEWPTWNLLKNNAKCDYAPSCVDFDRYLFLETLLSAREKLIISYLGFDPFDKTQLPASSVVEELLPFVSKKQHYVHLGYESDHLKFNPVSFSIRCPSSFCLPKGEFIIHSSELTRLARSCLRHYLHFQEIKIPQDKGIESEEPFALAHLEKAILRKEALLNGPESALKKAEEENLLPLGMVGRMAKEQLQEEFAAFSKKELKKHSLKPFVLQVTPSLTVIFEGSIEHIAENGLFIPSKLEIKNAVKAWPQYLLLHASDPSKRHLYFGETNEIKSAFFEDASKFLIDFVEHYFYAKENPLYLAAEWIEPILKEDLKKLMEASVYDPHLNWQLLGRGHIDYEKILSEYSPMVKKLYQEMVDAWF